MRLTAEQFNWRKENRVTGAYQVREPSTCRSVKACNRQLAANTCANCGRVTEFLFVGFRFNGEKPGAVLAMSERQLQKLKYYSEPFATEKAMVCLRCRPLSNLEIAEMSGTAEIIKRGREA